MRYEYDQAKCLDMVFSTPGLICNGAFRHGKKMLTSAIKNIEIKKR